MIVFLTLFLSIAYLHQFWIWYISSLCLWNLSKIYNSSHLKVALMGKITKTKIGQFIMQKDFWQEDFEEVSDKAKLR